MGQGDGRGLARGAGQREAEAHAVLGQDLLATAGCRPPARWVSSSWPIRELTSDGESTAPGASSRDGKKAAPRSSSACRPSRSRHFPSASGCAQSGTTTSSCQPGAFGAVDLQSRRRTGQRMARPDGLGGGRRLSRFHGVDRPFGDAAAQSAFYVGGVSYAMAGEGCAFMRAPQGFGARPPVTGCFAEFEDLTLPPGGVGACPGREPLPRRDL